MLKINEKFFVKVTPNYFLLLKKKDKDDDVDEILDDDEDFKTNLAKNYLRCGYFNSLAELFKKLPDKMISEGEKNNDTLTSIEEFLRIYEEYTRILEDTYKTFQVAEIIDSYHQKQFEAMESVTH